MFSAGNIKVFINICALLWISPAFSEIYKYQDENGHWHYEDRKPEQIENIEEVELKPIATLSLGNDFPKVVVPENLCPADLERRAAYYKNRGGYTGKKGTFSLENKSNDKSKPALYVTNDYFAPVEVRVSLLENLNMVSNPQLPLRKMIDPQTSLKVVEIYPAHPNKAWGYKYSYQYQMGDYSARHDSQCYYLPPVPPDKKYIISQAFNGSFSHNNDYNRYAIDVAMPEGTPVYAMRDGVVISKKEKYVLSGLKESFLSRANSLYILHGDGTIAIYAHLQFNAILVHEGMSIKAGDVIAKSGNTGFSTGPHLHFEVVKNNNLELQSMPFALYLDNKVVNPVEKMEIYNLPVVPAIEVEGNSDIFEINSVLNKVKD